jgi:two-component system, sensor histidine kinase ChiS
MSKRHLYSIRRHFTILILCLSALNIFGSPEARRGFINLTGWNFNKGGAIALNGEWEFYWNKLLKPEDFKDTANKPDFYIYQPGSWADANKSFILPTEIGYATYRIRVKIPHEIVTNNIHLGIRIEECHTSFITWINGTLVTSSGKVSADSGSFIPKLQPVYEGFSVFSDTLDIVIQASNFLDNNQGGLDDDVYLGTFTQMRKASDNRLMIFIFTFGILFFMIFYHLMLYIFRRVDKFNLSFMLVCIAMAIMSLWEGEKIIFIWFPDFPLTLFLKIWYCTPGTIGLMIMYHHHFYPGEFNKVILRIIAAFNIVNTLLAFILPIGIYTQIINYFLALSFLSLIYLFIVSTRCMMKKLRFSGLVFAGILIPIVIGINDVLYAMDLIETGYFGPIGYLSYVFTQSVIISYRFSQSFSRVESLTDELEKTNLSLENKVQNRTRQLTDTNQSLNQHIATKDKFLSILSHDLRATFQALRTLSGFLITSIDSNDTAKSKKITGWIDQSIVETDEMLENLITWTNMQSGKINILPGKLDVASLFIEVLETQTAAAAKKQITVKTDVEKKLSVWADQNMILLVLHNLISNAIKFTPKNGSINIKAYKTGNTGVIQISDTGIGVPDDKIDKLFKIETAFSTHGTDNEKGTGLGLLLCKESMNKNKGSILVNSTPGQGSTFILHLPMKEENK